MKQSTARKRSVVAGLLLLLAVTGGAIAYWTTSGAGTGTAATGTTEPVTIVQSSSPANLFPGSPDRALDVKITNDADTPQYITEITASVTGTDKDGCDAANYAITGSPLTVNQNVPGNTTSASRSGLGIKMLETGTNQDACKNATVSVSYSAN